MNSRYTTYLDIYNKLSRVHKGRQFEPDDIIEWCAECETDWIEDVMTMEPFDEVQLEVTDYKALLPCNLYRLLDVLDASKLPVYYSSNGVYLTLPEYSSEYIYINYYGIPVDESTGYPLIARGHEQACEAFCVWKIYYEDIITDRISVDAKNRIEANMRLQVMAAKGSARHYDNQELRRLMNIKLNMTPDATRRPKFHIKPKSM